MLTGLIYAAGVNSRLAGKIAVPFKGMLKTPDGKSLIVRQVESLLELGIDEVVIVVGLEHSSLVEHLKSNFPKTNLQFEYNPDYRTKGNMMSLWHARKWCVDNVCFTTSDLFFSGQLPKNFCQTRHSKILFDQRDQTLFEDPDPVKVSIKDQKILRVHKHLKKNETHGVAPGYYFFNSVGMSLLLKDIALQLKIGQDNQSLYRVLDRISSTHCIKPSFMHTGNWMDVDSPIEIERLRSATNLAR